MVEGPRLVHARWVNRKAAVPLGGFATFPLCGTGKIQWRETITEDASSVTCPKCVELMIAQTLKTLQHG